MESRRLFWTEEELDTETGLVALVHCYRHVLSLAWRYEPALLVSGMTATTITRTARACNNSGVAGVQAVLLWKLASLRK